MALQYGQTAFRRQYIALNRAGPFGGGLLTANSQSCGNRPRVDASEVTCRMIKIQLLWGWQFRARDTFQSYCSTLWRCAT